MNYGRILYEVSDTSVPFPTVFDATMIGEDGHP